jgi:hypothetical protein
MLINTYLDYDLILNIYNLFCLNYIINSFFIYMSSIAILGLGINVLYSNNAGKIIKVVGGALITGIAAGATKSVVDNVVFGDSGVNKGKTNAGSSTGTSSSTSGAPKSS